MRHEVVEIVCDVSPNIQAYDVEQTVAGALGQADERPGKRIDFFHRVIVLNRYLVSCRSVECADAVAYEVRSVFAEHDTLAESNVAICRDCAKQVGIGFRPRNNFHQMQIAGRIEEVRAKESAPEIGREAFANLSERNSAGVRCQDRIRFANLVHSTPEVPFYGEILGHRFYNPVAIEDFS